MFTDILYMVLSGVAQTFLKFDYSTVCFADFVPPCGGLKQITIAGINTKKIWHSFDLGIKKRRSRFEDKVIGSNCYFCVMTDIASQDWFPLYFVGGQDCATHYF